MKKLYGIIIALVQCAASSANKSDAFINELFKRYSRPVTVLEIGRTANAYAYWFSKRYQGTYVIMDTQQNNTFSHYKLEDYNNIVVVHPTLIDCPLLENLGKCEHFDIVIVRDIEQWGISDIKGALTMATTLGDHLFVELSATYAEQAAQIQVSEIEPIEHGKVLCYYPIHKKFIKKPRWTHSDESEGNYMIVSTFAEKHMDKQSTQTTTDWIPGINLLTFLVLKGVYPTDALMRKQLKQFKHINHNDLVIGNIVVQGRKLKPIDFNDTRRNVHPAICVKAALKKIIHDKRLKNDPHALLREYSQYLQRHKKRFH